MKTKFAGFICILTLCFMNCRAQMEIGRSIDSFLVISSDSTVYLLTSPAQFEKGHGVVYNSVNYRVAVSDMKTIKFIETADLKFKTDEGAFVGMPYASIDKDNLEAKVYDLKGWGRILKLHSGWYAVFDFMKPLTANSLIQFFYKN